MQPAVIDADQLNTKWRIVPFRRHRPRWRQRKHRRLVKLQAKNHMGVVAHNLHGTTMIKRDVTTSSLENVTMLNVNVHMYAGSVAALSHIANANDALETMASKRNVTSPLLSHITVWETWLATHPDRQFVHSILEGIKHGVNILYTGPRQFRVHPNWPSTYKYADAVSASVQKDLECGLGTLALATMYFLCRIADGCLPKKALAW